jgi:iron complex transport system substrate-binding protein
MIGKVVCLAMGLLVGTVGAANARVVVDSAGRSVTIPDRVSRLICSGAGSLRLLTYLQAQEHVIAVDDIEVKRQKFDARPYALANPRFRTLPVFGEFRGFDRPERILSLQPQPEVILKAVVTGTGIDPAELQDKTGIPVVVIDFGDLGDQRDRLYGSLRLIGDIVDRKERAEALIAYFESRISDLERRTRARATTSPPSAYVGGVAFKGPHGFQATEPGYPPFGFVGVRNLAHWGGATRNVAHADVAKEAIVAWDPDFLFLDLATLQLGTGKGAMAELRTDPAYRSLTAVAKRRVFGLLPYNWYSQNFESILANAYFIGKIVHPDGFADIDPAVEADRIFEFFVASPVFKQMDAEFGGLVFKPIPLD